MDEPFPGGPAVDREVGSTVAIVVARRGNVTQRRRAPLDVCRAAVRRTVDEPFPRGLPEHGDLGEGRQCDATDLVARAYVFGEPEIAVRADRDSDGVTDCGRGEELATEPAVVIRPILLPRNGLD